MPTAVTGDRLVPLLHDLLPARGPVLVTDPAVAAALAALPDIDGDTTLIAPPDEVGPGQAAAVLLLDDSISAAGERAATLVDHAVRACRKGGLVAVAAPSALGGDAADGGRAFTAYELRHMLAERGLDVVLQAAPGAAARLAGRPWAGADDLSADREAGLLDAGPLVLAAGVTPRSERQRSLRFWGSIPTKIVAASVVCTDADERILVVYDSFKQAWTLPGGLVDKGESPRDAAVREAREEGGVDVVPGELLGVFAHDFPDRVHLLYAARPARPTPAPSPIHTHEIDEVRWATRSAAEGLLDGGMRRKLRRCLDEPGGTWRS